MAKQTRAQYDAVSEYVDKLAQEDILNRGLYKAGVTQDMILDDMAKELAFRKIDISRDQLAALAAGGMYSDKVRSFHAGHNKWEKTKGGC